ncbi:MAG: hypothetical protein MZV63_00210 [Marinilabiliales bacterium]|nr:hypothetical protein [Marinilabiliales bacterium]
MRISCFVTTSVTLSQPAAALSVSKLRLRSLLWDTNRFSNCYTPQEVQVHKHIHGIQHPFRRQLTASGLAAGTYTVTVTDANSYSSNKCYNYPTCNRYVRFCYFTNQCTLFWQLTGSVIALGAGGNVCMNIVLMQEHMVSGTFGTLAAGTYTVTVRDATLSCTFDVPVTITQPAAVLSATATKAEGCGLLGGITGTATAVPAGGTGPYTYSPNTTPVQTTVTATGLGIGTHTVTVGRCKQLHNYSKCRNNIACRCTFSNNLAGKYSMFRRCKCICHCTACRRYCSIYIFVELSSCSDNSNSFGSYCRNIYCYNNDFNSCTTTASATPLPSLQLPLQLQLHR